MWTLCENTAIGFHHFDDSAQVEDCRDGKHTTFAPRPIDEHIELVTVANRRRNVMSVDVADGVPTTSTPSQRPGLRVVASADGPDDQLPTPDGSDPQTAPESP